MTIVVFDSSALVKLVVDERGSAEAVDLFVGCDAAVASQLAYPEVCAALAAATRGHRLTREQADTALTGWSRLWLAIRTVDLTSSVAERAGALAGLHTVRGADAVHLATCLALDSPLVAFASWDVRQRESASSAGLRLAPAALG